MGEIHRAASRAVFAVSSLMLATAASLAHGSTVTLAGGFTSFAGDVGTGQYVTTFYEGDLAHGVTNQYVVCPSAGCNGPLTTGPESVTFSSEVSILAFGFTQFNVQNRANLIGFIPDTTPQTAVVGQEILLGTLIFTNGTWFGDADFGFTLTTVSSHPSLDGRTFSDTLHLGLTPNDFLANTPQENRTSSISRTILHWAAFVPTSSRMRRAPARCSTVRSFRGSGRAATRRPQSCSE